MPAYPKHTVIKFPSDSYISALSAPKKIRKYAYEINLNWTKIPDCIFIKTSDHSISSFTSVPIVWVAPQSGQFSQLSTVHTSRREDLLRKFPCEYFPKSKFRACPSVGPVHCDHLHTASFRTRPLDAQYLIVLPSAFRLCKHGEAIFGIQSNGRNIQQTGSE